MAQALRPADGLRPFDKLRSPRATVEGRPAQGATKQEPRAAAAVLAETTESADSLETLNRVALASLHWRRGHHRGRELFQKLAIENRWIGETARVVQGGIVGMLLVYGGLRFVRAGYALYGQLIVGCGVAVCSVSTYAAFNFYHLIGQALAFSR